MVIRWFEYIHSRNLKYTREHTKAHTQPHKSTHTTTQKHTQPHSRTHKSTHTTTQKHTKAHTRTHKSTHTTTQKHTKAHTQPHKSTHNHTREHTKAHTQPHKSTHANTQKHTHNHTKAHKSTHANTQKHTHNHTKAHRTQTTLYCFFISYSCRTVSVYLEYSSNFIKTMLTNKIPIKYLLNNFSRKIISILSSADGAIMIKIMISVFLRPFQITYIASDFIKKPRQLNNISTFLQPNIFLQVMTNTSTHISWPSQLKIGAKCRKGSYIISYIT